MRKPDAIQQLIKEMDQRYLEMYHERNNPKNPNEDWPERKHQELKQAGFFMRRDLQGGSS
jgi:hypothetical protein